MNRRKRLALLLFLPVLGILFQPTAAAAPEDPSALPETIILISLDTVRADRFSCYGYEHPTTPNIDALAKESLFFENPFSTAPMTLPSHSSIFTGLIPAAHGVHVNTENGLPASALTLPEILQQNGYTTYGIVSTVVLEAGRGLEQGFDKYDDAGDMDHGDALATTTRNGKETTENAIQWLSENAQKKKFMFIHYFDPHAPYAPPAPYDIRFEDPYDGEIAFTDHCVGKIIDRLKTLDLYDKALIALVGDHGELLGEHGEAAHSFFIYQNVLRVPMMFKRPGAKPPKSVKDPSSLIDVAPTLLSMADIDVPQAMQGIDLSDYIRPDFTMPNRPIFSESMTPTAYNCSSLLGLVTGRWHYIQSTRPELYDRTKDPAELENLIDKHPDQARKMKEELKQLLAQSEPLNPDNASALDPETLEQLESLGYLDGDIVVDYSFEKGEEDAKDMIALANRLDDATAMAESGKGDLAIKTCTDIIRQYPKVKEAYNTLVTAHLLRKSPDQAAQVLDEMRELFPEDEYLLYQLAEVHIQRSDFPEALACINEFLTFTKDDPEALDMQERLVEACEEQKTFNDAIAALEERRAQFPDDPKILVALGNSYAQIKDSSRALTSYFEALAMDPELNEAIIGVGHIYYQMQDFEKALYCFKEALAQDPNHPSIHAMAAFIEVDDRNPKLYNPQSALSHAQAALKLSTDKRTGQCKSPIVFEALALAWAANSEFDEAIAAGEKALQLYNLHKMPAQANSVKRRIEGYRKSSGEQQ